MVIIMSFCKVLVIGESGVGKTSMTNKLIYNRFSSSYRATIGCEFSLKEFKVRDTVMRVQLWDLAGQDHFRGITRLYCREANGGIVVADVTEHGSIDHALQWKERVDENISLPDGSPIPMVLCLNKYDLMNEDNHISPEELDQLVTKGNYSAGFFTSALDGTNTEAALNTVLENIQDSYKTIQKDVSQERTRKNSLKLKKKYTKKKKCC